jgi:hypothetical protein
MDSSNERWNPGTAFDQKVRARNYSYALLAIKPSPTTASFKWFRREEWGGGNVNNRAMMIVDRNTGTGAGEMGDNDIATSYHNGSFWEGSVAWNDNHTSFESKHYEVETRYGSSPDKVAIDPTSGLPSDNIFEEIQYPSQSSLSGASAVMAHCGYSVIADAGQEATVGLTTPTNAANCNPRMTAN